MAIYLHAWQFICAHGNLFARMANYLRAEDLQRALDASSLASEYKTSDSDRKVDRNIYPDAVTLGVVTIGVLQIYRQAKNVLQICRQAKFGEVWHPHTRIATH